MSRLIQTSCFAAMALLLSTQGTVEAQGPAKSDGHHGHSIPIQRDYFPYPIDSRKPCNICVRPGDPKARPLVDLPGLRGRPHLDREPGGCTCGKKHGDRKPMISWNWPSPFSAKRQEHHPGFAAWLEDPCRARATNVFDQLGDFRLIPYQRTDNGHCGPGRDPYGCLGESRQLQSRVSGLQFRQPGEPVFGSPTTQNRGRYQLYPTPVQNQRPQAAHRQPYPIR